MRVAAAALAAVLLGGCGLLPLYTAANDPLPGCAPHPGSRARLELDPGEVAARRDLFVGVTLSGGGSRAANFAAAALLELDRLGLLPHVSAISSVSGGSLAAAYYGLFGRDGDRWRQERVRDLLRENFEARWIAGWFLPHNPPRFWLTDFDRADVMKGVFDDALFEGRTFRDLRPEGPSILLNATQLGNPGAPFVFAEETFGEDLCSRLETYPIAHAVMASGAFPGVFHNVTLEDYGAQGTAGGGPRRFRHVYDGGAVDNLGTTTIKEVIRRLARKAAARGRPLRGCFLVVVDAHAVNPDDLTEPTRQRDTRKLLDYFVDTNALDAVGLLLGHRRDQFLRDLGVRDPVTAPQGDFAVSYGDGEDAICRAWVLTFQRLEAMALVAADRAPASPPGAQGRAGDEGNPRLSDIVNRIPTRFLLTGPENFGPEALQAALFEAARVLIWEDRQSLEEACRWFRERAAPLPGCPAAGPGP